MDAAAFQHERRFVTRQALDLQNLPSDQLVLVPGEIGTASQAAPSVELPIDTTNFAVPAPHEGWAAIAHPGVIRAHLDEAHGVR